MTIFLKTKFDNKPRRFSINKVNYDFGNRDYIALDDYEKFKETKDFGVLSIWMHPTQIDNWYTELDEDSKKYFLFWEKGAISIPGNSIEMFVIER